MESVGLLDRAGRRRSQATLSGFHQGRVPRNKGLRYPPDPPPVEEIIAVMRAAGDGPEAMRLRGLIIVLWRAGLRISEALALAETDFDRQRGAVLVRAGKGGRRREVGMDRWAWEQLDPWLELRRTLPVGALFCVLRGPTRGRPCSPAGIRAQLHRTALAAGVRRRFAPHQLRHAHAVEMSREGIPLLVIQPVRACRPRDHLRVPARDRQHRDHPRGPWNRRRKAASSWSRSSPNSITLNSGQSRHGRFSSFRHRRFSSSAACSSVVSPMRLARDRCIYASTKGGPDGSSIAGSPGSGTSSGVACRVCPCRGDRRGSWRCQALRHRRGRGAGAVWRQLHGWARGDGGDHGSERVG